MPVATPASRIDDLKRFAGATNGQEPPRPKSPTEPPPSPNDPAKSEAAFNGTAKPKPTWRDHAIMPQKLYDRRFPDLKFIVPGLFPEGVTLVASRPKLGKSWLFLQIGGAVSTGATTLVPADPPVHGDVLYLALEDNERRLQRRLQKLFGRNKSAWPERLAIFTKWRRLDQGGIEDIREWCKSVSNPTLILIDTLKRVRAPKKGNQSDYDADYEASQSLQELAGEKHLAIMAAHHDRKMDADDVFDTVSGTLGLTGGVDTIAILRRKAGVVTLHIQGRDLEEEVEKAVSFDRETCRWRILGEASEVRRSGDRSRVLSALAGADEGLAAAEIRAVAALGSESNAHQVLSRMAKDGEIERLRRGVYGLLGTKAKIASKNKARPGKLTPVDACEECQVVRLDDKRLKLQRHGARPDNLTLLTGGSALSGQPAAMAADTEAAAAATRDFGSPGIPSSPEDAPSGTVSGPTTADPTGFPDLPPSLNRRSPDRASPLGPDILDDLQ
jgi:AAA domain/Transcriptional regulator, AbiEi antitoxin